MAYTANQYNYATPLSSVAGLRNDTPSVSDVKYFSLHDNVLDGSYKPIGGDVGLWGNTLSDASGTLSSPFVITVTDALTVHAIRIVGSQYNYPVAFTIKLYNGMSLLHTASVSDNSMPEYVYYVPSTFIVTSYEISITKISAPSSVARLYNTYNPAYLKRVDNLSVKGCELYGILEDGIKRMHRIDTVTVGSRAARSVAVTTKASDAIRVKQSNKSAIRNTIVGARDALPVVVRGETSVWNYIDPAHDRLDIATHGAAELTNIHSVMKSSSRRIYGKVYITYTDPMLDSEITIEASGAAYNSDINQAIDAIDVSDGRFFTLYDNDLSGSYRLSNEYSQTGWTSNAISDANGNFQEPYPYLQINFAERPIASLQVTFDSSHGSVPTDFNVEFIRSDGTIAVKEYAGNTQSVVTVQEVVGSVVAVRLVFSRVSKAYHPVSVLEIPVISTFLYTGYADKSDLISIDMLEELTYEDDVEALGGVSANEITVVLDNSSRDFFFNSGSAVSNQLHRNRKIVPWLGAEVVPGEIEWYTLGTYWSYNWKVPVNGLTATVVGFDTIGLLDTTSYTDHSVFVDKSIGYLFESILNDAKKDLDFIEYNIHEDLYDIVIPYAWFEAKSHAAALRKLSGCYPMHVYCDRNGVINAAPQKLRLDYYYDTWSDSTNVVDKTYDSLYTTLPNIVNVKVLSPVTTANKQIASDNVAFNVRDVQNRVLNFSNPYVSNISVEVDCDSSVSYEYEAYSWGIDIRFYGSGTVRSIICTGTALETNESAIITHRNEESIRLNGAVTRDISSDFIQTSSLAATLINRLDSLSEFDRYDATVNYRGDIALTINDPILLQDGIAPDNRYNIKRHQLSWNGALTGSADLNT